jgi:ribosomal-protein-alanine N-acetyltransferase
MLGPRIECGVIEGEPLWLVPVMPEHLPGCVRWFSDPEVTRYLGTPWCINAAEEEKWYARASENRNAVYWAIELGGEHIGQTGIEDIQWMARTGVTGLLIGEKQHWGKGIATAVMKARAGWAFRELNLVALYTDISVRNPGSLGAARKCGYTEYGVRPFAAYRDGEYQDSWLGVLTRDAWERNR